MAKYFIVLIRNKLFVDNGNDGDYDYDDVDDDDNDDDVDDGWSLLCPISNPARFLAATTPDNCLPMNTEQCPHNHDDDGDGGDDGESDQGGQFLMMMMMKKWRHFRPL